MEQANIVVIGAGIVGLAIAAELSKNNEFVYVLEKNRNLGQEVSTHNSGVIHSGIYYPKNSLKANLCIEGNAMIYSISRDYNIPTKKLGKLIVAKSEEETNELDKLMKLGMEKNIEGLKFLEKGEVMKLEPNVRVEKAIYVPSTGIIEPTDLMYYFYSRAIKNRAIIAKETEVRSIKKTDNGYELSGTSVGEKFTIQAKTVINSAGLYSDKIAEMIGLNLDKLGYRIHYCKGDYFRVSGEPPVKMLIYPVPDNAGLGIHLTPDLTGSVKLGPNAYYVNNIDYKVESSEKEFRESVSKFIHSIIKYEINVDSSGIRPKLQGPGEPFRDFVIKHETDNDLFGFINLIGIESPGLTAAPAIGKYVREIYENEIKK